jgi:hypothetical protein
VGDTEYRLDVVFNGKSDAGLLRGVLKVTLDDPEQKELLIPFRGTVR